MFELLSIPYCREIVLEIGIRISKWPKIESIGYDGAIGRNEIYKNEIRISFSGAGVTVVISFLIDAKVCTFISELAAGIECQSMRTHRIDNIEENGVAHFNGDVGGSESHIRNLNYFFFLIK